MIASRFRREISSFVCEAFFQWAMHLPFGQILLSNNINILAHCQIPPCQGGPKKASDPFGLLMVN
jgi:hypothetical protein